MLSLVNREFGSTRALFMIETILILSFSLSLFVYWFRYTVILLLRGEPEGDPGPIVGQLNLISTREALRAGREDLPLEHLRGTLHSDYRMLRFLMANAAGLGLRPLEQHLLLLDYQAVAFWYRLTRKTSTRQARRALEEMTGVLSCIAYKMGARVIATSQA